MLGVSFAHHRLQRGVDVTRLLKSKVMTITESAKVLGPNQARVIHRAAKPERGVQPVGMDDGARKTDALLQYYPRLLSVYGYRAGGPRDSNPTTKRSAKSGWFPLKVCIEAIASAGMPKISGHEAMTALGTPPKPALRRPHYRTSLRIPVARCTRNPA